MMLLPQSSPLPGLQCCGGKRDIDTQCVAPPHRPNGDTQMQPTRGWVNPGLGSLLPHVQRPSCHVVTAALVVGRGKPGTMETPRHTMWKSDSDRCFYFNFQAKENSWVCFSLLVMGESKEGNFDWSGASPQPKAAVEC